MTDIVSGGALNSTHSPPSPVRPDSLIMAPYKLITYLLANTVAVAHYAYTVENTNGT